MDPTRQKVRDWLDGREPPADASLKAVEAWVDGQPDAPKGEIVFAVLVRQELLRRKRDPGCLLKSAISDMTFAADAIGEVLANFDAWSKSSIRNELEEIADCLRGEAEWLREESER